MPVWVKLTKRLAATHMGSCTHKYQRIICKYSLWQQMSGMNERRHNHYWLDMFLWPEHVSGAENGAERAENGVSGSGAVSGFWKKLFERERSGLNRLLKVRSHQHCVEQYILGCYHLPCVVILHLYRRSTLLDHYVKLIQRAASCSSATVWEKSGAWVERAGNRLSGSGAGSGCHKIGFSGERQIGRSRSAHMRCLWLM